MKAVILVGGQGTRLLPLKSQTPKAMMPVLNRPFLEHIIRRLADFGIKDIILTSCHLSQPIEEYFGNGDDFGVFLSYVIEESPLGTAGAIKNTASHIDGTFLVLIGDIFTDINFQDMVKQHRQNRALATIALTLVDDPSHYGLVETKKSGRVQSFLEKPSPKEVTTDRINAGCYIMEKDVLKRIPENKNYSAEKQLFPGLLEEGAAFYSYYSQDYWIDIGNPHKYLQLNRDLLSGRSRQIKLEQRISVGENCRIHPTAEIHGSVLIGHDCVVEQGVVIRGPVVIGDLCYIGEDSIIEDSVSWRGVFIGNSTFLGSSIVAEGCNLGSGSIIRNSILSHNVTIPQACILKPGSSLEPGTVVNQVF
jgi:mannose-1-phosphate guanylyltransferase